MTTTKQIESNRRNALESTVPRTAEGKTRSRLNGPQAQTATPSSVDRSDLNALSDAFAARFQPQGPAEERLVRRIAHALWRRTHLANMRLGLMSHGLEGAGEAQTDRQLKNLARYEASLTRSSRLALRMLRALQSQRPLEQKLRNEAISAPPSPPTS